MAGLATEITRRAVLVVAALPGQHRLLIGGLDRALLQVLGQGFVFRHPRLGQQTGDVFAVGPFHNSELIRKIIERGLGLKRRTRDAAEATGGKRDLRAVVMRQVADRGIRDIVTGTAKIHGTVIVGLQRGVLGHRVAERPQFIEPRPHDILSRAVVTDRGVALVVGDERRVLHPEVFGLVRIGQPVAEIAFDSVMIPVGERGAVGGHRTTREPAGGRMAADTQVTRAVDILLGDGQRGPEKRIATGQGHHAPLPVVTRLDGRIVTAVTEQTLRGRIQAVEVTGLRHRAADLARLRTRHPDFIGNSIGGIRNTAH